MTSKSKYIPLDTSETAVLQDANTLLPRDEIYEPLAKMIEQALLGAQAASTHGKSLNEQRAHNAISIDGARGTGKTVVLVNLKRYLELEHKNLLSEVHILEPIDPTLLEDGESLFLHIIVAAVLHDEEVKQAQRNKPEHARILNQTLDKLAHALESIETQKERHGMDKVRAMYGNKHLADCVQNFFREAVQLVGKKLLILPIDDVDTSLNRAFENLEIIRRYLTTPYVLPIVSGDRALYHEVTWRDFHGRLSKDSSYRRQDAYKSALDLAEEYQRKILPFPRRLTMPLVSRYWHQPEIKLGKEGSEVMPLRNFIAWLEVFLAGPVNGQEDSRLQLPIPSIRALTQLVGHCSTLIPQLPPVLREAKSELEVRRIWQMPTVPLGVMEAFQRKHQELGGKAKREYGAAYKEFADEFSNSAVVDYSYGKAKQEGEIKKGVAEIDLPGKLADYFRFEPKAGVVFLVLQAKQYWRHWAAFSPLIKQGSIFDTPLFQPLAHNTGDLALFDKTDDLSAWQSALNTRLPEEWLSGLKIQKTILPYPVAEVGVNAATAWGYQEEIQKLQLNGLNDQSKSKAIFLIKLLGQHYFYTNAKQTMLLNIGRVFELIISSIAGPFSQEDLHAILSRAPFFSTRALAPTKTLLLDDEFTSLHASTDENEKPAEATQEYRPVAEFDPVAKLQQQIESWRTEHGLDQIELSPWLVYKVFNKVYSQVASGGKIPNGMKNIGTALNMVAHTFYATWSAFGSFEKGELFGLPNVVATTNLNSDRLNNFEKHDHFTTNVGSFAPTRSQMEAKEDELYKSRSTYGKQTRTISYCLSEHPLRMWIDEVIKLDWPKPESDQAGKDGKNRSNSKPNKTMTAKEWLLQELNLGAEKTLTQTTIKGAIEDWSEERRRKLLSEMQVRYENKREFDYLKRAISGLSAEK